MLHQVFNTAHCGQVVVTHYQNREKVTVVFIATGHTLITTKDVLTKSALPRLRDPLAPSVFGIGSIGIGTHKAHVKGADTRPYSIWRAMLRRCYYRGSKHHQKSYEGVTVCNDWLCFQRFADWYEANYPNDGEEYQLDKDIKSLQHKTYSPETCLFVTRQANTRARTRGTAQHDLSG